MDWIDIFVEILHIFMHALVSKEASGSSHSTKWDSESVMGSMAYILWILPVNLPSPWRLFSSACSLGERLVKPSGDLIGCVGFMHLWWLLQRSLQVSSIVLLLNPLLGSTLVLTSHKKPVLTHYLRNHQKCIALSLGARGYFSKNVALTKMSTSSFCLPRLVPTPDFHWVMTISIQAKWQVKRAQWGTSVVWTFFNRGCSVRSHVFWVQIPTSF